MIEDFTASNGITISFDEDDRFMYSSPGEDPLYLGQSEDVWWGFTRDSRNSHALAEYYRAKEDERLGRWRWPENPDIYARPMKWDPDAVGIVKDDENGLAYGQYSRTDNRLLYGTDPMNQAARAYFDAHPEPKPWRDAVEGEVWELEFKAGAHAWFVNGDYFQSTNTLTNIHKTDSDILSARKIWPTED